jgi:hypothetical protein
LGHLDFDFADRIAKRFVFGAGQVLCGLQELIILFRTDAGLLVVANRVVQHSEPIKQGPVIQGMASSAPVYWFAENPACSLPPMIC